MSLESKILQLEQEIIVLKQQVPQAQLEERSNEEKQLHNDKVLQELNKLETRYRNTEEELR